MKKRMKARTDKHKHNSNKNWTRELTMMKKEIRNCERNRLARESVVKGRERERYPRIVVVL